MGSHNSNPRLENAFCSVGSLVFLHSVACEGGSGRRDTAATIRPHWAAIEGLAWHLKQDNTVSVLLDTPSKMMR